MTDDEVLAWIKRFVKKNKYAPSVKEIADGLGIASTSTVHAHLVRLQRTKRIVIEPFKSRTIRLVK